MIAKQRLSGLTQKGLTTDYTTTFQQYATQTKWNQEALMAKYKQRLKWKVQDALIYMPDATTMRGLIDQVIKIDNRIYERERASKGQEKSVPKKPQQTPRQWYGGPEPMD